MNDLTLTGNRLNQNGHWKKVLTWPLYNGGVPTADLINLFDQNGYDLTELEQYYAKANVNPGMSHRYHKALKQDWFTQEEKTTGAILNHSLLFERKGYTGAALDQLKEWAKKNNLIYKLIAIRPKWGLDFSIDYVDNEGNAFEIFHWEFDGFDFGEINAKKQEIEKTLSSIDWDDAGKEMLKVKDQWHHLGFFEQSDWKCKFFGIEKERFKMVIWN